MGVVAVATHSLGRSQQLSGECESLAQSACAKNLRSSRTTASSSCIVEAAFLIAVLLLNSGPLFIIVFRFDYSRDFLMWALTPPHYRKSWHICVRVKATKKCVAFVSGIPALMSVYGKDIKVVPRPPS